jgi:hypothetical protein
MFVALSGMFVTDHPNSLPLPLHVAAVRPWR